MFEDFLYFPFPEVEYVSCLEVPVIRRVYKFNCEAKVIYLGVSGR